MGFDLRVLAVVWTRPGGGETSGGSLRSSRQAVACHPFTRSWATMPPEAPPPPGLLPVAWTFGMDITMARHHQSVAGGVSFYEISVLAFPWCAASPDSI